jgi:hypothetical protein
MQPNDVNKYRRNIYATMVYFDMFDWPLTIAEIEKYLLWDNIERRELWIFLNNDENIQRHGDFYFFKGRRDIVEIRKEREIIANGFWKRVNRYVPLLKAVPFVKMVAVCNTLAINNTDKDSDIDIFVVASPGRLFMARTITTMLFAALGVRRHGKKIAGRFCLSFFVTEDAMDLRNITIGQEDIYMPFWILTMRPLYGESVYLKMLSQNKWIQNYFPRPVEVDDMWKEKGLLSFVKKVQESVMKRKIGDKIENWLESYQKKRYQKRISTLGENASVVVNEKMLKYHNVDKRADIAQKFKERLEAIKPAN